MSGTRLIQTAIFMAIGCWLLAVGWWLLAIGYWLATGCARGKASRAKDPNATRPPRKVASDAVGAEYYAPDPLGLRRSFNPGRSTWRRSLSERSTHEASVVRDIGTWRAVLCAPRVAASAAFSSFGAARSALRAMLSRAWAARSRPPNPNARPKAMLNAPTSPTSRVLMRVVAMPSWFTATTMAKPHTATFVTVARISGLL